MSMEPLKAAGCTPAEGTPANGTEDTPSSLHASSPARRIAVVAGILWDGQRFLAVERPEGKPQAGFWEFPGGKIEPGETPADALARELREELGVTPVQAAFWRTVRHDYPHLSVELHFFHVTGFTGTVTALEGHRFAWLTWDEAMRLPFLEADLPLVADLRDGPGSA